MPLDDLKGRFSEWTLCEPHDLKRVIAGELHDFIGRGRLHLNSRGNGDSA